MYILHYTCTSNASGCLHVHEYHDDSGPFCSLSWTYLLRGFRSKPSTFLSWAQDITNTTSTCVSEHRTLIRSCEFVMTFLTYWLRSPSKQRSRHGHPARLSLTKLLDSMDGICMTSGLNVGGEDCFHCLFIAKNWEAASSWIQLGTVSFYIPDLSSRKFSLPCS